MDGNNWTGISCYEPRKPFIDFHARKQRWAAMVCHRRAGKTVSCIADLVMDAAFTKKPDARYAYIAPQLNQAKDIAWTYLKRLTSDICKATNESELWVELLNGSRIRIYGADNYARIKGGYLNGVIMDEYADMRPVVWNQVVRPMLSDRKGWAVFIGTPMGKNEFWQIYNNAKADPEWFTLMLKASESGLIDLSELSDAGKAMTPEMYAQEYECSFDAAIQGAYWGKELSELEASGRIKDGIYNAALPVHTAWDLGVGDSTVIWCFQVSGQEIRIIDAYENSGEGLEHYAGWLNRKPYKYGDDWVPHDARVTELGTGRTRVETLISLGRKPKLVPGHKLMDGINAVRLTLPKVWFDRKCASHIETLKQYRCEWDEKNRCFKDNPKHDWTSHAADAFRYMCMAWKEIAPSVKDKPPTFPVRGEGDKIYVIDDWNPADTSYKDSKRI